MKPFAYDSRYPSRRSAVHADSVVATSQPLATQAGIAAMRKGGNAIDAAIAAAITLTVVEPTGNGIGSDAFAILWDGERLHGLNASGASPRAWTPDRFAGLSEMPALGWDTVTVPGAVSAWVALSERFGALPFDALFADAIRYARHGFTVSPIVSRVWTALADVMADQPGFAEAFLPAGRAPRPGQRFALPVMATTLESIASSQGSAFYRGELAEAIAAHADAHGGALGVDDLATHECTWVDPISQAYHDVRLHEIPPNGQGLAALQMLGMLRFLGVENHPVDSAESLHLQIEAMKLAFADTHAYVADPGTMTVPVEALLDDAYLASRADEVDPTRARTSRYGTPPNSGTVYVSTADAQGRMVSFIQSNYQGFGSGVVVPGTGISLQNRGRGFTVEDGHPNQVGPGKRPFHTIIPAFLTDATGEPRMSFGVMGGPMQPQGHAQMVIRTCVYGQDPQVACDAPRWRWLDDRRVAIEPGFPDATLAKLEALGHELVTTQLETEFAFGGAQLVWRTDSGYVAGSDPRKDGQAAGF